MKTIFKYVLYLFGFFLILIVSFIVYIKVALPNVGDAPVIAIDYTAERIARGRYIANAITVCMDCHSTRDFSKFAGPLIEGTLGKGGDRFDQSAGMPGVFFPKNITPFGISRYTDGELYRTITTGVSKEGRAMFPLMPFSYYGRMDKEDIYDIIAYVRSIPPIVNEVADATPDFPLNILLNTLPHKETPQTKPLKSDVLAYGAYITNAGACAECHTQVNDKAQILPEFIFGGGREFKFPDGSVVRSANISADKSTGIGNWTEDMFIQRFKVYADSAYVFESVKPGEFNSVMPWAMYSQMEREDLAAIYKYLISTKAINNSINKFTSSNDSH